jgi:O-antigen/teichoic acid export membrane protein
MAVTAVQTIFLARLLPATVFGEWGLLMAALTTILTLTSVGFDDKYIQQDHPDQEYAFQIAFTLVVVLGIILLVLVLVGIPVFALIYGRTNIILPGLVLGAAVPALVLEMPLWVHYRRMDFARQRKLQLIAPVVTCVATLALAIAGLGLWALALGAVIGTWAAALAIARTSPYKFRLRWDRATAREYTSFSAPLFIGAISTVLLIQVPVSIGSRVLGAAAVGAMSLANSVTNYTTQVDGVVTQTLYPVICAVKDKPALLRESFWKSNRLALLWATPMGLAAALFAGDFVHLVIGEKWRFAVPLLAIVGLNAAVNQIAFNWTAFFRAVGDTKPIAIGGIIGTASVLAIAVPLLAVDGLTAFAIGLGIATVVGVVARLWLLRRIFSELSFAWHIARGIGPSLPAAGVVLLVRLLDPGTRTWPRVAVEAILYLLVASLATYLSDGRLLRESGTYLRRPPVPEPTG